MNREIYEVNYLVYPKCRRSYFFEKIGISIVPMTVMVILGPRDGSLFSTVFDLVQRRRYRSFLSTDHSGSLDVSHLDDLEFDQD